MNGWPTRPHEIKELWLPSEASTLAKVDEVGSLSRTISHPKKCSATNLNSVAGLYDFAVASAKHQDARREQRGWDFGRFRLAFLPMPVA